ncbi:hypothetical protein [Butyrivibrio hungatei]|uniref:Uncharacterized protein n=1 Tax=Butyrivibrio hungatei TaxID=185008 RepID=A0A1D9NZU5_9FIRM|nr:hypothetical protein [Butyrivibrio hungatei]AOZ95465.1 hypothetical protein bhn_I0431 [Butyrivibrio hungatei]
MTVDNQYYSYYREIEDTFLDTEKYVAIDSINFATFSTRYNWLLQSICSEVDSIFKIIARNACKKKYEGISDYYIFAKEYLPVLFENTVEIPFRNIELKPFASWEGDSSPKWWKIYNGIKHDREKKNEKGVPVYKRANLEMVLNALAGLYLLENYLIVFSENDNNLGSRKMIDAKGKLFVCKEWNHYYQGFMGQKLFPYSDFKSWLISEGVKC